MGRGGDNDEGGGRTQQGGKLIEDDGCKMLTSFGCPFVDGWLAAPQCMSVPRLPILATLCFSTHHPRLNNSINHHGTVVHAQTERGHPAACVVREGAKPHEGQGHSVACFVMSHDR